MSGCKVLSSKPMTKYPPLRLRRARAPRTILDSPCGSSVLTQRLTSTVKLSESRARSSSMRDWSAFIRGPAVPPRQSAASRFLRAVARDGALGCRGRQPGADKLDYLRGGEAVRAHDRPSAAVGGSGEQLEARGGGRAGGRGDGGGGGAWSSGGGAWSVP